MIARDRQPARRVKGHGARSAADRLASNVYMARVPYLYLSHVYLYSSFMTEVHVEFTIRHRMISYWYLSMLALPACVGQSSVTWTSSDESFEHSVKYLTGPAIAFFPLKKQPIQSVYQETFLSHSHNLEILTPISRIRLSYYVKHKSVYMLMKKDAKPTPEEKRSRLHLYYLTPATTNSFRPVIFYQ